MMKKFIIAILILSLGIQIIGINTYCESNKVPYKEASSWAIADLNEAADNGLITDRIMNKMNAPITREEFAELAVLLYEKSTGKKAAYGATFADTKNVEIYKAFNLQIVNGTDMKLRLFSPNVNTNREQVASMFYRTIKAIKDDEDLSIEGTAAFLDEEEVSAWALDPLKYMNKHGYLLGSNGKINPKGSCTKEMAVIIANRIYKKYTQVGVPVVQQEDSITSSQSDTLSDKAILVINDFDMTSGDYRIVEKDDITYIFITIEKAKYAFKYPYVGYNTYPEVTESQERIIINWKNNNEEFLQIDLQIGNSEAQVNGMTVDLGMAPYREGEKTFVPINLLMAALEMDIAEESTKDILFIQLKKDFPVEVLAGTWSDVNTDLFTGFKDIASGLVGLSSFATSYMFEKDGTYKLCMISVGGFYDKIIHHTGKYRIMGNTIMFYDVVETLYNGNPFKLVHEDKYLEKPYYDFIDDYNAHEDWIKIDLFRLDRKK